MGVVPDPEVLKELRTAPDLTPQTTKVMARTQGRAMSTLVVQLQNKGGGPFKPAQIRLSYVRSFKIPSCCNVGCQN